MRQGQLFVRAAASVVAAVAVFGVLACGSTSVTEISAPSDIRCATVITADPSSVAADGGSVSITVATTRDCAWTSSSDVSWIRLSSASGQGEASFTASVDANPQIVARSGSVAVNGQRRTITQAARPCSFGLDPESVAMGAGGGSGKITVTTVAGCTWRATTTASWIEVPATSSNGPGTLEFQVSENDGGDRTGVIAIADRQVVVTQAARAQPVPTPPPAPNCTPMVNPVTIDTSSAASTQTIQLVIGPTCPWTVASATSWLTITSALSGMGSATVSVSVGANTGAARSGTVTVAAQAVTVRQTALACTFAVNPTSQTVPASGGNGRFTVNTANACSWSASKSVPWIDVARGTGTGPGDVTFAVQANTSSNGRSGTITVGGQAFTVTQAAAPCSFSLNPTSVNLSADAVRGRVGVTTSANCAWTAAAAAPWVVVATAAGTGPGDVAFDVLANPATAARSTTITIGGQVFTVNQAGVACTYAITPPSINAGAAASNGQFTVTTQAGCAWTAVSAADWAVVTLPPNGAGSGSGDVIYSVTANPDPAPRVTTITAGGQAHTINQAGAPAPCTYTLNAPAGSWPAGGGTTAFTVQTQPGCAWTATTMDPWITINTGSGTGTGDIVYSVAVNATGMMRAGTILVAGQSYGVTQAP